MAIGDAAEAAGLTIIDPNHDLRTGPTDINRALDQVVGLVATTVVNAFHDEHEASGNDRGLYATNIQGFFPKVADNAPISIQNYLQFLYDQIDALKVRVNTLEGH